MLVTLRFTATVKKNFKFLLKYKYIILDKIRVRPNINKTCILPECT